jgi:hypothetical protein
MALACVLKAESLLSPTPGDGLDALRHYKELLESSLGSDAVAKVHRDRDTLVNESLEVKF